MLILIPEGTKKRPQNTTPAIVFRNYLCRDTDYLIKHLIMTYTQDLQRDQEQREQAGKEVWEQYRAERDRSFELAEAKRQLEEARASLEQSKLKLEPYPYESTSGVPLKTLGEEDGEIGLQPRNPEFKAYRDGYLIGFTKYLNSEQFWTDHTAKVVF